MAAGAAASPPTAKARPKGTTPGDDEQDDEASGSERSHVVIGSHGIVVEKGGKRLRVEGLGHDRDYDSFEQFVRDAPWLAGLVFFTVLLVFLIPLLIIVLLIWYKIRKNRMANETMLKLAERGIVPPAAAIDAVATGTAAPVGRPSRRCRLGECRSSHTCSGNRPVGVAKPSIARM